MKLTPHKDIEKILFTPDQIQKRVKGLAQEISRDYKEKDLMLISILKGSVVFLSDILRLIEVPCSVDFMSVSSYGGGSESSGTVRVGMDLRMNPEGKDLLLVEDILDTGLTMRVLMNNLKMRKPSSVKICAFLDKRENRKVEVEANYIGFEIPNHFVVGYGLDYSERYRNLPYIGILKKSVYADSQFEET